eukprot:11335331-Prorocentrum_lima.AAC.1
MAGKASSSLQETGGAASRSNPRAPECVRRHLCEGSFLFCSSVTLTVFYDFWWWRYIAVMWRKENELDQ